MNIQEILYNELAKRDDLSIPLSTEEKWKAVREHRDVLLFGTDWLISATVEKAKQMPQDWIDYRQALRDIPETYATPEEVVLPEKPLDIDVDTLPSNTPSQNGTGYCLSLTALNQATTTDGQSIYWGGICAAPSGTAGNARVYIPKSGTIKTAYIFTRSATIGTSEAWISYIRLNNTTDTLIKTLSVATNARVFFNNDLNIPVVAGDYIEIKEVCPTWATNPANVTRGGYIYIE